MFPKRRVLYGRVGLACMLAQMHISLYYMQSTLSKSIRRTSDMKHSIYVAPPLETPHSLCAVHTLRNVACSKCIFSNPPRFTSTRAHSAEHDIYSQQPWRQTSFVDGLSSLRPIFYSCFFFLCAI